MFLNGLEGIILRRRQVSKMGQIVGAGGTPNINIWVQEEADSEKEA